MRSFICKSRPTQYRGHCSDRHIHDMNMNGVVIEVLDIYLSAICTAVYKEVI